MPELIETVELTSTAPQMAMLESTSNINLFLSGVGSGKTHALARGTAEYIINDPELVLFIGANTYGQLSSSTLFRTFEVWAKEFSMHRGNDFVIDKRPPATYKRFTEDLKEYNNIISFRNGCRIMVASLDNYKVIDGTQFAAAFLDETKDTKEEAVKEVITMRLRQPGMWLDHNNVLYKTIHHDYYTKKRRWVYMDDATGARILYDIETMQQIRSFNPLNIYTSPAKVQWLNEWFGLHNHYEEINRHIFSKTDFYHLKTPQKNVVISSSYHNQENLPVGWIEDRIAALADTPSLVDMLIYASPIAKSGGEYAHKFKRTEHVGNVPFIPYYPVHITLDFNIKPYITCLCAQYEPETETERGLLRIFKEYCLKSPFNNTESICANLEADYGNKMTELFYYGDPGGRIDSTSSKEYRNDYAVLERELSKYLVGAASDRVLNAYPALFKSRNFLNNLLAGKDYKNDYGIDVVIDKSCINFINDLEFGKEDPNGGILKTIVQDKETGDSYQKYGHTTDAFRYLIVPMFENLYEA